MHGTIKTKSILTLGSQDRDSLPGRLPAAGDGGVAAQLRPLPTQPLHRWVACDRRRLSGSGKQVTNKTIFRTSNE